MRVMNEAQEREWAKQNRDESGYAMRTVWGVNYSFDPKTGDGFREEIRDDVVVSRRPARIEELFG